MWTSTREKKNPTIGQDRPNNPKNPPENKHYKKYFRNGTIHVLTEFSSSKQFRAARYGKPENITDEDKNDVKIGKPKQSGANFFEIHDFLNGQ